MEKDKIIAPSYDINDLPISEATFKGLTPENIDTLGTLGRMMSMQDQYIADLIGESVSDINKLLKAHDRLLKCHAKILANHEERISDLEEKLIA